MIVWTDTETTGLHPPEGSLLEVALVVTSDDLIARASTSLVVRPITPYSHEEWVARLDPFIREMHTKNGLLDDVRDRGLRRYEAEDQLVAFARGAFNGVPDVPTGKCACGQKKKWHLGLGGTGICDPGCDGDLAHACGPGCDPPAGGYREVLAPALSATPLAGSTVGFDRAWLDEHMPALHGLFHYRSIDVSTITELAKRWSPGVYEGRPKAGAAHRALADVMESISYLRYYREVGFVGTDPALVRADEAVLVCALHVPDLAERDRQVDEITARHPSTAVCPNPECLVCGVRDCRKGEPLHYDKDGCPARCSES